MQVYSYKQDILKQKTLLGYLSLNTSKMYLNIKQDLHSFSNSKSTKSLKYILQNIWFSAFIHLLIQHSIQIMFIYSYLFRCGDMSAAIPLRVLKKLNNDAKHAFFFFLHAKGITHPSYKVERPYKQNNDTEGGDQLWGASRSHIFSQVSLWSYFFFLFSFYALCLLHFLYLVSQKESFISMKCTSLAMWYWVGCLRSITLLSTQREHLPQSLNSLTALGKCHTNMTSAETCTNNNYSKYS